MNNTQITDNELQRAIDDIARGAASAGAQAARAEEKLNNRFGLPPVDLGQAPAATHAAAVPVGGRGGQGVNFEPVALGVNQAAATPVAAGPAPVAAAPHAAPTAPVAPATQSAQPAATPSAKVENLEQIKEAMLKDLFPIMDKIKVAPEQKFKIYRQMIEKVGDKKMISKAYEATRELKDEAKRAEALLFLLEQADKN